MARSFHSQHVVDSISGELSGGSAFGAGFVIRWKPPGEDSTAWENHVSPETVLLAVADRLRFYQRSSQECSQYAGALALIQSAIAELREPRRCAGSASGGR